MLGIKLKLDKSEQYVLLNITPSLVMKNIEAVALHQLIQNSEFKHFYFFDENIFEAIDSYKSAVNTNNTSIIEHRIGERRDTVIKCKINRDQLSAYMTITTGYAGTLPTVGSLKKELELAGIKRGISNKRLAILISKCLRSLPGDTFEEVIAKGLPPRVGKPSKLKPLVQNALDRILKPQPAGSARVDMRNLGAIISVQKGIELLRRIAPTDGRNGYTVTGNVINSESGEWIKFRLGSGTVISDSDKNLVLSDISGMPKFKDKKMWVDSIYSCKGVNVGSGNINYDGSVLVNGDVTEKMEIYATGDITINGFVESATIHAGGDIIITEGAMGKVNDSGTEYSSSLTSKGNIHIQHGQGLDIYCPGNVTVGRQLAYSRINCGGKVIVGAIDNPNGNIFACTVKCKNEVIAGTLGAVSGSNLTIDFSDGFNTLLERKDTLDDLLAQIKHNNARHFKRMNLINSKLIPEDMQARVDEANELFNNELQLLELLENKASRMLKAKQDYQTDIKIIGNKRVYSGVVVKLNNRTWRAKREYDRAKICFYDHQWHFEPLL